LSERNESLRLARYYTDIGNPNGIKGIKGIKAVEVASGIRANNKKALVPARLVACNRGSGGNPPANSLASPF